MNIIFSERTDTTKFDKNALIEQINSNDFLYVIDKTVELDQINPCGSAHQVIFQAINCEQKTASMLDQFLFNVAGVFQVYS